MSYETAEFGCSKAGKSPNIDAQGESPVKTAVLAAALSLALAFPALAAETRCGWIQNPTPANWWLDDAENTWTIMTQGSGEEPEGMDLIPDISEHDYVRTNGNYGYACACMNVDTDDEGAITRIHSVRQLPLSRCRSDRAIGWFLHKDQ